MNEVLSVALQGLQSGMARVDRVALNLAHAQTTAYKRDAGAFAGSLAVAEAAAPTVRLDERVGTLRATRQPLDLALAGAGWFEVTTPHGPAYTRQGDFQVDAQGRLVTRQGLPVSGVAGDIRLPHGAPRIDERGAVFDGVTADPVARLKVVRFEAGTGFQRMGDGLLAASTDGVRVPDAEVDLRQGHLENSNVSSLEEMVQLVRTLRHFESVQKALLGYDEMLAGAIRRLGEPT
ncbi:MAG TPA: flagellar hook-basal body protein [Ramlibacter sp.]|nr:flagellar hook-basal body protein [Ramlibacter sp.]